MKPLILPLAIGGIVAMLIGGCSGSKSFAKKGEKLDASGLYAEAADMYLQSLMRNNRNVDAKIGLKKTGQMLLNDKLSGFFKEFSMGDSKEAAVNAFLGAKAYADRVGQYGVVLDIPGNYQSDFSDVKGKYLVELYTQGQDLLAKQDFKGAEALFARIGALEPGYKDAGSLQNVAYLEPLYRNGKEALAQNHFRRAYDDLGKVVAKDPSYKDASALRNEAVDKGKYSIAALPFGGTAMEKAQAARLNAYVISSITEINDPFIKVVDRENIERILEEQRLGMSGVVDEATAVSAGKLLGAQAVLMGSLMDFREENGQLKRSTKDGFASYQVKQPDPNDPARMLLVTKFKPVKYTEYYQENKVFLSFSYKLVSLETGEVLMSKVVDQEKADHAYYATYDGDGNTLYPSRNGVVEMASNVRRDLVNLLSASKEVKPTAAIANDLCRQATAGMAATIREELTSKLQ